MLRKTILTLFITSVYLFAQDAVFDKREGVEALKEFEGVWKNKLIEMVKKDSKGIKAINYCADNILNITKEMSNKYKDIEVRRTSLKYRNPVNAPDEKDIQVLTGFNEVAKMRKIPEMRIITTKDYYRIYKPLVITQPICLKCHGTKKRLHPGINKVLDEKYPDDKAVNFRYKHVRGAIVTTIKRDVNKTK